MMIKIKTTKKWSILLLLQLYIIASCSSDEQTDYNNLQDGKSTVIEDLAGDTGAAMGDGTDGKEERPFHTFLFRFSDKKQLWLHTAADSLQYMKTNNWDIAFTGPYNSEVYLNNANYLYNPGFEGPAINTAVIRLDQAYENVTQAPSDETFNDSDITKIGWASSASSPGWFFYSLETHIMQAIPNRTYALRLPNGKYAKLQLINAYKGNPPAVTDLNWPAPYFTFRYFVQEDGSKNLNTK
ncbi:HmuY family protein [Flavobacterium rakeshii]|uniref:HmuY family protein n=1 Tax=Flavobacterium rakeshii TaxID=1038845 RepID=UPI002E7BC5CC|nr:HmuY family protein [Flavobacterium rakeshii]MEE1896967.1 HmuY family protein [Flavobacterium rakeshii]